MYKFEKVYCIRDFDYKSKPYKKDEIYLVTEYYGLEFYITEYSTKSPLPLYPLHCDFRINFVSLQEYRKLKLKKLNESRR